MRKIMERRDFLKTGLTALLSATLGFYPTQANAQNDLTRQLRDIDRYVRTHSQETKFTRLVPPGQHKYSNVEFSQYDGGNFKIKTHNFGLWVEDFSDDRGRLFYNSRDNGLRNVDVLIGVPRIANDGDISVIETLSFASPRALTSLVQSTSQRRNDIRGGQRLVLDETNIRRRNPNGTMSLYDFKNQTARRLNYEESIPTLREMQEIYQEVVERIVSTLRKNGR